MTRKMVDADFFALRPSGWNYEFKRRYVWLVTSFSELYAFVVFFVVFFVQKLNVYSEWSTPTSTRAFRLA